MEKKWKIASIAAAVVLMSGVVTFVAIQSSHAKNLVVDTADTAIVNSETQVIQQTRHLYLIDGMSMVLEDEGIRGVVAKDKYYDVVFTKVDSVNNHRDLLDVMGYAIESDDQLMYNNYGKCFEIEVTPKPALEGNEDECNISNLDISAAYCDTSIIMENSDGSLVDITRSGDDEHIPMGETRRFFICVSDTFAGTAPESYTFYNTQGINGAMYDITVQEFDPTITYDFDEYEGFMVPETTE